MALAEAPQKRRDYKSGGRLPALLMTPERGFPCSLPACQMSTTVPEARQVRI